MAIGQIADINKSKLVKPLPLTATGQATPLQPIIPNVLQNETLVKPNVPIKPDLTTQTREAAQTVALEAPKNETLGLTTQKTQDFLNTQQLDIAAQKQTQLEQFDRGQAQGLEALRQKTAGRSTQDEDLTLQLLRGNQDRSVLGSQLDLDLQQRLDAQALARLSEGRATAGLETDTSTANINNLINASQAGEGQANRDVTVTEADKDRIFNEKMANFSADTQTALTNLNASIASDVLMSTQEFQNANNVLDRELEIAIQNGDTASQINILQMKQEFDSIQTEKNKEFATSERIATQAWQTGENLTDQDFAKGMQYIDHQNNLAIQNNDIEGQNFLQTSRFNLETMQQLQGFDHTEKMFELNNAAQQAFADGDFEKQKQLMNLGATIDFKKIEQTQGFDAAQADLNRKADKALQDGDFAQANLFQKASFAFQTEEAGKDRFLQEAGLALQEKGLDMQELENNYNKIQEAVSLRQAAPSAALDFINDTLASTGITLTPPDPEATRKAIEQDYQDSITQYLTTHPESANPDFGTGEDVQADIDRLEAFINSGNAGAQVPDLAATVERLKAIDTTSQINSEGLEEFNSFFNESVFGEESATVEAEQATEDATQTTRDYLSGAKPITDLQGVEPTDPAFLDLQKSAPAFDGFPSRVDGRGLFSPDIGKFVNPPANGSFVNIPANRGFPVGVYQITSSIQTETDGEDHQWFTMKNVRTGEQQTVRAPNK